MKSEELFLDQKGKLNLMGSKYEVNHLTNQSLIYLGGNETRYSK